MQPVRRRFTGQPRDDPPNRPCGCRVAPKGAETGVLEACVLFFRAMLVPKIGLPIKPKECLGQSTEIMRGTGLFPTRAHRNHATRADILGEVTQNLALDRVELNSVLPVDLMTATRPRSREAHDSPAQTGLRAIPLVAELPKMPVLTTLLFRKCFFHEE